MDPHGTCAGSRLRGTCAHKEMDPRGTRVPVESTRDGKRSNPAQLNGPTRYLLPYRGGYLQDLLRPYTRLTEEASGQVFAGPDSGSKILQKHGGGERGLLSKPFGRTVVRLMKVFHSVCFERNLGSLRDACKEFPCG